MSSCTLDVITTRKHAIKFGGRWGAIGSTVDSREGYRTANLIIIVAAAEDCVDIEAPAILLSIGGEASKADGIVIHTATIADAESGDVVSILGIGSLVADIGTHRENWIDPESDASGDTSALGVVGGKHVTTIGLGKDTITIHKHAQRLSAPGPQDGILGVLEVKPTILLKERGIVSKAAHGEASTIGNALSPEPLEQFAVLSVGQVERNGGQRLIESRLDGTESLLVVRGGQLVERCGNHKLISTRGRDKAVRERARLVWF